jgi:hypothetical protein
LDSFALGSPNAGQVAAAAVAEAPRTSIVGVGGGARRMGIFSRGDNKFGVRSDSSREKGSGVYMYSHHMRERERDVARSIPL